MSSPPTPAVPVSRIVAAVGHDRLRQYISQIFPAEIVAIGYYTVENAESWLEVDKFMRWVGHQAQGSAAAAFPATPLPQATPPAPIASSSRLPPSSPPAEFSPLQTPMPPAASRLPNISTGDAARDAPGTARAVISIDSDDEELPPLSKLSALVSKPKRKRAPAETLQDRDSGFVYRLDLTGDTREWTDSSEKPLSMAAIIKLEDQDSWGGRGSGGTTNVKKATKVVALDDVLCQLATHDCQGVYICDQIDDTLLDGHERYEPDEDDMRELFEAERDVNVRETSSVGMRAAAFYARMHRIPCHIVKADGTPCDGLPVYRSLTKMNLDGKYGFIGCQGYRRSDAKRSHRLENIPRDVKEDLVKELFANNGEFKSEVHLDAAACARVSHPRNGGKGDRVCPYTHVDENNRVVQGKLIHRPCGAKIRIYSPLDRTDRRAIVSVLGPHNHPKFPSTKVTRKGKDKYMESISNAGATGLTVVKCDSAPGTQRIFNGQTPAAVDPALANARVKRNFIKKAKMLACPHGLQIEGVMHRRLQMLSLPHEKQYIWHVSSGNNLDLVITMLPFLAGRIHVAKASLHDNTYARIHGAWKEWEVVVWDDRYNCRLTIGRIYSQHEKYETFMKMWPGLFETIEKITKAEVKFKFIDGEGLRTVLVDGNKPQANALGAYMVTRNRPQLSGVFETEPKRILPNVLRTCTFHVERKFTDMAKVVPDEPMARIRRCLYIKTQQELEEFIEWCKNSEYKVVRDWIADKESIPWFFPSINRHFSKIPEEDWYLTPGDNLNESAHPYTNKHTGTNLSLLEAIDSAYKLDCEVEAKLCQIIASGVLMNHRNTKPERDSNNARRRESHRKQAADRFEARTELQELDDAIQRSAAETKQLREQKKALQSTSGVKKTKRKGEQAKENDPDSDELAGLDDTDSVADAEAPAPFPQLRMVDDEGFAPNDFRLDSDLEPPVSADFGDFNPEF
ncbi:hypothetical protein FB45DRAFT_757736 [Roridomyces roridus]|uniref:Uncharacterized protein n=1 Tax=Roridomyces roridus TaxID=1738132 RepID=A0AAD7FCE9_9AGAR|nr:hypothetical protein FB45DRAFT_757736 [Roridomyces roridus]